MLLKFPLEQVMIGGLPGKTIPVLGQYQADASGSHQVSHPVHSWSLEGCPTLASIQYLLQNLVAFADGILPQSLELLGQGITAPSLLLGRHARVENDPSGNQYVGVQ